MKEKKEPKLFLTGDKPRIRRKKKRLRSILKWGSLALVGVIVILLLVGYIWLRTKESRMRVPGAEEKLVEHEKGTPENTLIMGLDKGSDPEDAGPGRSDTIMVVSVDKENKRAVVFSIPRDTRTTIPGTEGEQRINSAYSLGGPLLAIDTVKEFTGLPIHHFAVVDFEGFKRIVDAIGGVEMYIDKPINDEYAGSLPAGDINLTGEQALVLMRARHDPVAVPGGDLDRVKNQQHFVRAMLEKLARQRNIFRIKTIIDIASANIKTDLSFTRMLSLGKEFNSYKPENIQMTLIPGEPELIGGTWYYIVDEPTFQAMMERIKVGEAVASDEEIEKDTRSDISVKVLNGTGKDGLAQNVADSLTAKGYLVSGTGNATEKYKTTTIYYSGGGESNAGKVAVDLEGSATPTIERSDNLTSNNGVQILVVLGMDYST